jgi:deoxyadenosine/deoxycytidine kinase
VDVNHELGTMNDIDYKTYTEFYENVIIPNLEKRAEFDIVIYLKVSTEKAIARIAERGRVQELETPREYWEVLNTKYEEFYNKRKDIFNFLVVDADTDDIDVKMQIVFDAIEKMRLSLKK